MFLRAGLVSLILLLASRASGLVREIGLASVLGAGPLADAVILMLTLPDLLVGVAVAGASGYVLIPYWSQLPTHRAAVHQAYVLRLWIALGAASACVLWVGAEVFANLLGAGARVEEPALIVRAVHGAALAAPLAIVAVLLGARLQMHSDVVGLYGANLLVNVVLLVGLAGLAWFTGGHTGDAQVVGWMALALMAAMLARLVWQMYRLALFSQSEQAASDGAQLAAPAYPGVLEWCAAIVVAGAPIMLYLVARSLAARDGEGALSVFNYAWKLVELPQLLAVQLVATLALPAVSRAVTLPGDSWIVVFRRAFALTWVLACSALVVLVWGSAAIAEVMFGWGRMDDGAVEQIAVWARVGAWTLMPSAVVFMWLVVFASKGHLQRVANAWLVVSALAMLLGWSCVDSGVEAMVWLNVTWFALAAAMLWRHDGLLRASVPWVEMLWPTLLAALSVALALKLGVVGWGFWAGVFSVACILLVTWRLSPNFKAALQFRSSLLP